VTAEQLRDEIEDARRDLGDTAAALAAKTDVKARTSEKADELRARVRANPVPLGVGVGVFVLALVLTRRRGRR
jgi:hypothetical protein